MRKAIFGLGFFLLLACSGQPVSDESNSGAAAASGEEANGGGSGDTDHGGTSSGASSGSGGVATGGSGGASPTGGVPAGGAATGGSDASGGDGTGEGGEAGAATGGSAGHATGGGGQSAGTGGRSPTDAECDPADGDLETTPYPDCEPRDLADACELCIQAECCAESKVCYGYEPGNVCGWGGPTTGAYAGLNEIDCYVACVRDYVSINGAYDDGADGYCVPSCTTASCGLIGNATQDLVVCMRTHCEDDCFWP